MTEWFEVTRESMIPESYNWANWYVGQIKEEIEEIESKIENDEEINITIPIDSDFYIMPDWFGYRDPNLIIVKGKDHNNNPVTAFIPRTRFTVLLSIVKKENNKKKERIWIPIN